MKFIRFQWLVVVCWLTPMLVLAGGNEVVVVYNSRLPASKAVAEHYAEKRQVPADQIFGFALTTNEVMSRADFTEQLQLPLAEKLAQTKLWQFGDVKIPGTNGAPATTETRVVKSKIRYVVLCYGVPLKIAPSSQLQEAASRLFDEPLRKNEAAVDSELAWLPLVKTSFPLTGPHFNPLYACTNRAELNCTNGILLVTRLDGPTPEIAEGLVDKAMEAEANGLWGRAYFDARGLSPSDTNYYLGDAIILGSADIARQIGFEVDVDTNEATFPASLPMSQIAVYAGWYAGGVCGPFTAPKMEFMPGAFAYHLHSFSAATVRSATQNWCGPLLAKGATCTMGCVYEPYLQFTPNVAQVLAGLGNGFTFGEAAWAGQNVVSWQTTVIGDPLYRPFGKSLVALHARLAREKSPLLAWSFDRLICLDLARGVPPARLQDYVANMPLTPSSAVLTEKLAEIYEASGKPISAIAAWQQALKLDPSPQQRLRLRLTLGAKLIAEKRFADARQDYRQLLAEAPDYPGKDMVEGKLQWLETQLNTAASKN